MRFVRLGGRGTDHAFRAITSMRSMPNRRARVHEQSSLRKAGDGGPESMGQLPDPPPKSHRGSVHAKTAAGRAPRLADVDRRGAVRRLNTSGMKISLTRSISFHLKRWQNKQARF